MFFYYRVEISGFDGNDIPDIGELEFVLENKIKPTQS